MTSLHESSKQAKKTLANCPNGNRTIARKRFSCSSVSIPRCRFHPIFATTLIIHQFCVLRVQIYLLPCLSLSLGFDCAHVEFRPLEISTSFYPLVLAYFTGRDHTESTPTSRMPTTVLEYEKPKVVLCSKSITATESAFSLVIGEVH